MFTAALLTTAKIWKRPVSINRGKARENVVYTHRMEYYPVIKKNENVSICNNMDGPGGYYTK